MSEMLKLLGLIGLLAAIAVMAHFATKYILKVKRKHKGQWKAEQIEPPKNIAGFGIRAVAFIIDLVVFFLPFGLALNLLGLEGTYLPGIAVFVVWCIYYTVSVIFFGNTIGKKLLGLKIVSSRKKPITPVRIVLRAFFLIFINWIFFGGGFWMVIIDKNKQGLHDKVAYTYVVRVKNE